MTPREDDAMSPITVDGLRGRTQAALIPLPPRVPVERTNEVPRGNVPGTFPAMNLRTSEGYQRHEAEGEARVLGSIANGQRNLRAGAVGNTGIPHLALRNPEDSLRRDVLATEDQAIDPFTSTVAGLFDGLVDASSPGSLRWAFEWEPEIDGSLMQEAYLSITNDRSPMLGGTVVDDVRMVGEPWLTNYAPAL